MKKNLVKESAANAAAKNVNKNENIASIGFYSKNRYANSLCHYLVKNLDMENANSGQTSTEDMSYLGEMFLVMYDAMKSETDQRAKKAIEGMEEFLSYIGVCSKNGISQKDFSHIAINLLSWNKNIPNKAVAA